MSDVSLSESGLAAVASAVRAEVAPDFSTLSSRLDGIDAQILAVGDSTASRVVSSLSGDTSSSDALVPYLQFTNASLLFILAFTAVLVGMLFFREFSGGFRHA